MADQLKRQIELVGFVGGTDDDDDDDDDDDGGAAAAAAGDDDDDANEALLIFTNPYWICRKAKTGVITWML